VAEEARSLRERISESLEDLRETIEDAWDVFRSYAEMTRLGEVARRFAVTNSFDGLLTILGVVAGSYVYGVRDPRPVLSAGIGAIVGITLSAAVGTYITEMAERAQEIREMEAAVLTSLEESVVAKAHKVSALVISLASSLVPAGFTSLAILPFALTERMGVDISRAFALSIGTIMSSLFLLGAYLGHISGGKKLFYGLVEVAVGVAIVVILLSLGVTP